MKSVVGVAICAPIQPNEFLINEFALNAICDSFEDVVLFDFYKTNKLTDLLHSDVKVIKVDIGWASNWNEIEEYYKDVIRQTGVRDIVILKMALGGQANARDNSMIKKFEMSMNDPASTFCFTFITARAMLSKYLFVRACSQVCESVVHYVYDPCELLFEKHMRFKRFRRAFMLNKCTNGNEYHYMPCVEFGAYMQALQYVDTNKSVDFVFYCTVSTKEREWLIKAKNKVESIEGWDVGIKNNKNGADKAISQYEYYEKLSRARYTVVIPSYDRTTFSVLRFFEALFSDCLPLVLESCCLDDLRSTYNDICVIVERELLVKSFKEIRHKIASMSESDRLRILCLLKDTKSYRRLIGKSYTTDKIREFLEM